MERVSGKEAERRMAAATRDAWRGIQENEKAGVVLLGKEALLERLKKEGKKSALAWLVLAGAQGTEFIQHNDPESDKETRLNDLLGKGYKPIALLGITSKWLHGRLYCKALDAYRGKWLQAYMIMLENWLMGYGERKGWQILHKTLKKTIDPKTGVPEIEVEAKVLKWLP